MKVLAVLFVGVLGCLKGYAEKTPLISLKVEQLTSGKKHHFFGYIGQCQTIPWNASGRYVLGLEVDRIDRMPNPDEASTVFVIDTDQNNEIVRLDKTHAWNPQQGTMFYWNPLKAETQFFFNDRDVKTGKVFTVLYDLEKKKRVHEYRYDDSPIGNGGVAADGSAFLGHKLWPSGTPTIGDWLSRSTGLVQRRNSTKKRRYIHRGYQNWKETIARILSSTR